MLKDESKCHPDSISEMLEDFYPDEDPWLCIAKDIYDTEIKRKSEWQKMDLTKHEFLLPNPLKDNTSRKADNISEVRYWTYESDQLGKNWDIHAACILNLSKKVHLQCATYSGGKSIHALFKVKNYSKDYLEHFRERVFMLGGDPSTLKPQQFCRLPVGGEQTQINLKQFCIMAELHKEFNDAMLQPGFFDDAPSGSAPKPIDPAQGEQPQKAVANPVDDNALPPFMSFADFPKQHELIMPAQLD